MTSQRSQESTRNTAAESPYAQIFHYSLDGLMLITPDGSVVEVNPAACQMFGRTRDEILREGRHCLMDASDPRLAAMLSERERSGRARSELRARRKDGSFFVVEVSSVVFLSAAGEARASVVIRDITHRKESEVERERRFAALQQELARAKQLGGVLPMCASCRKIRDQQGAWHDLEAYIRSCTGADFSHGICPDCRKELYP